MTQTATAAPAPLAVMTIGLPGAGKSTIIRREYDIDHFAVVDPDAIKATHPDYDPKDSEGLDSLHRWSTATAEARMHELVAAGRDFIWDGTGTNAEKMVRRANDLRANGYRVELLYVRVSTNTALARNAARERNVPERVVLEKAALISTTFEIVAGYVDSVQVINND